MPGSHPHIAWLKKAARRLTTADGKKVTVYELKVDFAKKAALRAWAKHFREHYCLDSQIDRLRRGPKKSRSDYLIDLVFPDKTDDFGPATRSADFAEILIADLLETEGGYLVPRTRYGTKTVRNESAKGADVIGLLIHSDDPDQPHHKDVLITCEAKAQLKSKAAKNRLQDAVDDSRKDVLRLAESLNAMNRRLIDLNNLEQADYVQRFQNANERPYVRRTSAAAVYSSDLYDSALAETTDCSSHENRAQLGLIVIHAKDMMDLVHMLYEEAANGAG